MHHAIGFIQDLAVIMVIAAAMTILFHRLRQPVVLGYIIAGVVIGPHTPPFELIQDETTISTLAELGVVFLLFSLGLEFSLKKIFEVGLTALIAALSEIVLMVGVGYQIGRYFGWSSMDALFLGAMLAISSTTIIVKALDDLGLRRERFAQLVFGVLIVEDILAIAMIALLSGVAGSGSIDPYDIAVTLCKLVLFMTVSLVVGILLVPRLLNYVARFGNHEVLLITVLGLCFGFCLIVVKLEYSIALGAFLMGAIMAESRHVHLIARLIQPVRDLFSAIFFVAIGLMLDPRVLVDYAWPITVITLAVVAGKVISCGAGSFLAGQDGKTALRVGMSLSQIGEFSFIIATLGTSLKVTSGFLYPIAVTVSALTTLSTPYLIRAADPAAAGLARWLPKGVRAVFACYTAWLSSLTGTRAHSGDGAQVRAMVLRLIKQMLINLALVAAIFMVSAWFSLFLETAMAGWIPLQRMRHALLWGAALLLSMPFLVAIYRKLKALTALLAEISISASLAGRFTPGLRRGVAGLAAAGVMSGVFVLVAVLSGRILPPRDWLLAVLLTAAVLLAIFWKGFVRLHATLQIALRENLTGASGPDVPLAEEWPETAAKKRATLNDSE